MRMLFQTFNGKSANVDVKGLVYFEFEKKVYTVQPLLNKEKVTAYIIESIT